MRRRARAAILAAALMLGVFVCNASTDDVRLETTSDGGFGTQQASDNAEEIRSLEAILGHEQRRLREGVYTSVSRLPRIIQLICCIMTEC